MFPCVHGLSAPAQPGSATRVHFRQTGRRPSRSTAATDTDGCPHHADTPGFTIPARTGTYRLVLRQRSRTRPPWWQGRLCPSRQDSAAFRCGPAAIRFFHPGFFRGQPPSELRPPRVVPPIKPMRGKNDTRLDHDGECRSQRDTATDALATTEVSSYFADAGRVRMFPCVHGLSTPARPQPATRVRFKRTDRQTFRIGRDHRQCPFQADTLADSRPGRGSQSLHAREHTDSSRAGEVGRDLRGDKGVCVRSGRTALLTAVVRRDSLFSSRVF
jgi:hypothetical protein